MPHTGVWRRLQFVGLLTVIATVLSTGMAAADCRVGPASGGETLFLSYSGSHDGQTFVSSWNKSSRFLDLEIHSGGLPSGRCADSIYDWAVASGHFDWRIARTCKEYAFRGASAGDGYNERSGIATFVGMQKQAVCYFRKSDESSVGCIWSDQAFSTDCNDPPDVPTFGRWAIRMWIKYANGTVDYFDGGDETSASD